MPLPRLTVVALLAAVCLTGCGDPAAKLHGKWKMAAVGGTDGNPLAAMAAKMMTLNFEFKGDGTCGWNVDFLGQKKSGNGTWRFVKAEGKDLVVAIKFPPQTTDQEVRIVFKDDDHCSFTPPEGASGTGQAAGTAEFAREK